MNYLNPSHFKFIVKTKSLPDKAVWEQLCPQALTQRRGNGSHPAPGGWIGGRCLCWRLAQEHTPVPCCKESAPTGNCDSRTTKAQTAPQHIAPSPLTFPKYDQGLPLELPSRKVSRRAGLRTLAARYPGNHRWRAFQHQFEKRRLVLHGDRLAGS